MQAYIQAQTQANIVTFKILFDPFVSIGRREVVNPSISPLVLVKPIQTTVAYKFSIAFIAKETRGGHLDLIFVKLTALLHFCNIVSTSA